MPLSVEGDVDGDGDMLSTSRPAMSGTASGRSDVDSSTECWVQREHEGQWQVYDEAAWDGLQSSLGGNGDNASSSSDVWVAGSVDTGPSLSGQVSTQPNKYAKTEGETDDVQETKKAEEDDQWLQYDQNKWERAEEEGWQFAGK
eukprot:11318248-Karenia_brevis.AAC.1